MLNNVPLPGQNLLQTRDLINDNFTDIDTAFSVNHVAYNSGANEGKHNFVTMPNQAADPATLVNETAIYTKTVSGLVNMFFRNQNNGSIYNLTGSNIASVGTTGTRAGYFYVGGFLIKFGYINVPGGTNALQNFPTMDAGGQTIPAFANACVFFQIGTGTVVAPVTNIGTNGTQSTTQFNVINGGSATINNCPWIAIGY